MPKVKIINIKKRKCDSLEVVGTVTRKERTQRSKWREHALSTLEDETGSILLNLWRDQINQVNVGDTICLKAGFTEKRKGVFQLSTWEEKIEVLKHDKSKTNLEQNV